MNRPKIYPDVKNVVDYIEIGLMENRDVIAMLVLIILTIIIVMKTNKFFIIISYNKNQLIYEGVSLEISCDFLYSSIAILLATSEEIRIVSAIIFSTSSLVKSWKLDVKVKDG
jgi:hypothetical protein